MSVATDTLDVLNGILATPLGSSGHRTPAGIRPLPASPRPPPASAMKPLLNQSHRTPRRSTSQGPPDADHRLGPSRSPASMSPRQAAHRMSPRARTHGYTLDVSSNKLYLESLNKNRFRCASSLCSSLLDSSLTCALLLVCRSYCNRDNGFPAVH